MLNAGYNVKASLELACREEARETTSGYLLQHDKWTKLGGLPTSPHARANRAIKLEADFQVSLKPGFTQRCHMLAMSPVCRMLRRAPVSQIGGKPPFSHGC